MKKNIIPVVLALVLVVGTFLPAASVKAALITDADVTEQTAVVHESIRVTLFEQVKLIQMVFIQLLEVRIAELQAQQAA